jgi:hypothetical protein
MQAHVSSIKKKGSGFCQLSLAYRIMWTRALWLVWGHVFSHTDWGRQARWFLRDFPIKGLKSA